MNFKNTVGQETAAPQAEEGPDTYQTFSFYRRERLVKMVAGNTRRP